MPTDTKLLLICLTAITVMFIFGVLRVLGTWCEHHISRHNLVVASKHKRLEYYRALAERDQIEGDIEIEADEEGQEVILADAA